MPSATKPLGADFFEQPALTLAPRLLGCTVVVGHGADRAGPVAIRLTEVEAYEGAVDPGSHAYRGRTPRNAVMFGPSGRFYVYFTYGMHHCANIVCGSEGWASAVLLRAGEVVTGMEVARRRRSNASGQPPRDVALARGPGNLARSLGMTRSTHDGVAAEVWAPPEGLDPHDGAVISNGPRVGVSGPGGDGSRYPWRWWISGDPTVSAYRVAVARPRDPARGQGSP